MRSNTTRQGTQPNGDKYSRLINLASTGTILAERRSALGVSAIRWPVQYRSSQYSSKLSRQDWGGGIGHLKGPDPNSGGTGGRAGRMFREVSGTRNVLDTMYPPILYFIPCLYLPTPISALSTSDRYSLAWCLVYLRLTWNGEWPNDYSNAMVLCSCFLP